jgi:hypothetical protein
MATHTTHTNTPTTTTPRTPSNRPTNIVEWIISGFFLIVVLKMSYTTFTVVGLIVTMAVLFAAARGNTRHFRRMVANNDWVLFSMVGLAMVSCLIALLGTSGSPLPELNPLKWAWSEIKETVAPRPKNPYANDGIGPWIHKFLLGEDGGWWTAAVQYGIWSLIAYPVSRWDNWKAKRLENHEKAGRKGGIIAWFVHLVVHEIIAEAILSPFKGKSDHSHTTETKKEKH